MRSIYPVWFCVICSVVRLFFRRLQLRGAENICKPCVFVARHLNNYGPAAVYLFMPEQFHLWTYYPFMEPKAYAEHVVKYTFTQRVGMPVWLAKLCAQLLKYPATWAYRKVGMIPVYRGIRKTLKTMEITVEHLEKGENVLIFPDVDYMDSSREMGEMYTGFIRLGRMYYQRTGKRLSFQPVEINRSQRYMRFAKPIEYDPTRPICLEKERIIACLRKELADHSDPQTDALLTAHHTP